MRNIILISTVFVFSACTTGNPALEQSSPSDYVSTLGNTDDENLMLKKAVVKLIRKYNKLNEKTDEQAKQIRALNSKSTQHDKEIKNISSGMSTIKKFVSEDVEDDYSIEVGMPVVNLRSAPSIDANIRGKVSEGKKLELIEKPKGNWSKVKYNNEPVWIHNSTLKKER